MRKDKELVFNVGFSRRCLNQTNFYFLFRLVSHVQVYAYQIRKIKYEPTDGCRFDENRENMQCLYHVYAFCLCSYFIVKIIFINFKLLFHFYKKLNFNVINISSCNEFLFLKGIVLKSSSISEKPCATRFQVLRISK